MARKNYGYMATIGADTSGLQTSLAQIDSQCRGLDSSLRQVGRSIQDGMNTGADVTEAQAQQLTLLSQRADLARQRLQQLESVQNQMRNALASGQIDNNAMARYTADVQNARNAVARYEQQIQTLRNAQAQAADATNTAARAVNNSADAADNSNNKHLKLIATLGDIINIAERVGRAMVGVVSSAVDATAKNEQLVGGVQTLFGEEAAEKIIANANKAFNTVGVSANNYLETVTSFSTSLIQSLGGDTEQAVQLADMALTDMSDNANKMGTDLAMIQYSYQSFAKGQFQLLDNLKLGYGGTKAEMERLIADANRLNAEQGKATDYQLENYADIIRAIHDIQENMGIMGTTAAEAAGTVSGSMQAFQAALENLKAGLGTADADIEALLNNVTMNFEGMMNNMMPVIENVLLNIPEALTSVLEVADNYLPMLLESVSSTFTALMASIVDSAPDAAEAVTDVLMALINQVLDMLPDIQTAGMEIFFALVNGITEKLPELIPVAVQTILTLVNGLLDNVDELGDAAVELIMALAEGLISGEALAEIVKAVPIIINKLVTAVLELAGDIFELGVKLAAEIVEGISSYDYEGNIKNVQDRLYNIGVSMHQSLVDGYNQAARENNSEFLEEVSKMSKEQIADMNLRLAEEINRYTKIVSEYRSGTMADWSEETKAMYADLKAQADAEDTTVDALITARLEKLQQQRLLLADVFSQETYSTTGGTYGKGKVAGDTVTDTSSTGGTTSSGVKAAADKISDEFKAAYEQLKYDLAKNVISDTEYTAKLRELLESSAEYDSALYTKYWNEVKKAEEKATKAATETKKATEKISEGFKTAYEQLKFDLAKGIIDEDTYISQLRALLESSTEYNTTLYTQYWKEVTTAEEKALKAADEVKNDSEKISENFKKAYEELKMDKSQGVIDDNTYIAQLRALLESSAEYGSSVYSKYWQEVTTAEAKARKEATDEAIKAYKDAQKQIESAAEKMTDGSLYQMTETTTGKKPIFADLSAKANDIKQYAADYTRLSQMDNIPPELLEEIRGMSFNERKAVVAELLRMTENNRNLYFADYNRYKEAQRAAAEVEYADELQTAGQAVHGAVVDMLSPIIDKARSMGEDTAQAYIDGMNRRFGTSGLGNIGGGVLRAAVNVTSPTVSNKANNTMISGNTPINISIAGTNVIKTTLDKLIGMNRLTSGNNLGV